MAANASNPTPSSGGCEPINDSCVWANKDLSGFSNCTGFVLLHEPKPRNREDILPPGVDVAVVYSIRIEKIRRAKDDARKGGHHPVSHQSFC